MSEPYDIVIIGGGSAGLTAADFGRDLGARVALVEKHHTGGDCTWTGCIPSKALINVANIVHVARTADRLGIKSTVEVDMEVVRAHVQATIRQIYQQESPEVLRANGVDVYLGGGHFLDPHTIEVSGQHISGKNFLLATGARPSIPPVAGLSEIPYLTYETFFDNDRLPEHLLIIGAGAVGAEMAQAYRRLGSDVTIVDVRLLPRVEEDAANELGRVFTCEGIEFIPGMVDQATFDQGVFSLHIDNGRRVNGDMLLSAAGRRPNVEGLGLGQAGVAYSAAGIEINDNGQTSASHIYAAGDVTGGAQFTHYAGWQAFAAARNALLPGSSPAITNQVPYAIFTDPEIAHTGLTEADARQQHGEAVCVTTEPVSMVDRAVTDAAEEGFIKLIHLGNGELLGATIVAHQAAEMIQEYSLAIANDLKIRQIAEAIHVYPTYSMSAQTIAAQIASESTLNGTIGRWGRRLLGYKTSTGPHDGEVTVPPIPHTDI